MKTLIQYLCIAVLLITVLFSCKKGDTGLQGPAGPQGTQGAQGVAGPSGSQILSGNGTPASTLGANGDYYLDMSTSNLYGPKTASGWGSPLLLKGASGASGAAGTNGNTVLSGTGAPSASLGNAGDYYLDETTYNIYGPKTTIGWGVPVSLVGPKGNTGTANVIYSDWFTPAAYTVTTNFGIIHLTYNQAAPALTQAIMDSGTVLVYGMLNGYNSTLWPTNQVGELPISIYYQIGTATNIDIWSAIITVGNLQINLVSSENAYTSDGSIDHSHTFRYVIIPGGIKATANINFKDYSAVKATFHLSN